MTKPYRQHLKSSKSLETSYEAVRAGFVALSEAFARKKLKPHTFFIGAAIEAKMTLEIWDMLQKGGLENAANLTEEDHITSVTSWLCSL